MQFNVAVIQLAQKDNRHTVYKYSILFDDSISKPYMIKLYNKLTHRKLTISQRLQN